MKQKERGETKQNETNKQTKQKNKGYLTLPTPITDSGAPAAAPPAPGAFWQSFSNVP